MKIVAPHEPAPRPQLLNHGFCETAVQLYIVCPIVSSIRHTIQGDVTERPQHLIRIPLVPSLDLFRRQPDATKQVCRRFGRNCNRATRLGGGTIRFPAPPRDPDSTEAFKNRIERRREPSIGPLAETMPLTQHMLVRLPIRYENEFGTRLRRPHTSR